MDAGDSTAFMRLASASSVVGAERLRDRDFFGFSEAVTLPLGEDFGRERPSKSEFSFSTNLMSKSARRPSSDAFLDLKNQSKLNCQAPDLNADALPVPVAVGVHHVQQKRILL